MVPIVWGLHKCENDGFASVFDCPDGSGSTDASQYGASYDWAGANCNHAIDQGAICYDDVRPSQMNPSMEACRFLGDLTVGHDIMTGQAVSTNYQAAVFGCGQHDRLQATSLAGLRFSHRNVMLQLSFIRLSAATTLATRPAPASKAQRSAGRCVSSRRAQTARRSLWATVMGPFTARRTSRECSNGRLGL